LRHGNLLAVGPNYLENGASGVLFDGMIVFLNAGLANQGYGQQAIFEFYKKAALPFFRQPSYLQETCGFPSPPCDGFSISLEFHD
jgi:hypothetical protein